MKKIIKCEVELPAGYVSDGWLEELLGTSIESAFAESYGVNGLDVTAYNIEVIDEKETQGCSKCGGRLALVTGDFSYEPDEEPYFPDVREESVAKGGVCELIAYKCDECENLEGFSET